MILNFDSKHVLKLLQNSISATERRVTFAQQYDEKFWSGSMSPERYQELRMAIDNDEYIEIDDTDLDYSKVPSGLWLVGDEGVYLMSNGPFKKTDDMQHVCYANECNPLTMDPEECSYVKNISFGPDDGVDFLTSESILQGIKDDLPLSIKIDSSSLIILHPSLNNDVSVLDSPFSSSP